MRFQVENDISDQDGKYKSCDEIFSELEEGDAGNKESGGNSASGQSGLQEGTK